MTTTLSAPPECSVDGHHPETSDRTTTVEAHGIDHIPDSERHGRPRQLFAVWAASNINYLSLVVGGGLVLMGLSLGQALAVIVVGNLFWALPGFVAISGPASGTPSEVITRAIYGIRANRVYNFVNGWLISVAYFALNLAAAGLAANALLEHFGIPVTTPVEIGLVVGIAAVTLTISVIGHGLIMKIYLPITIALAVVFGVLAVSVGTHADLGYTPDQPLTGTALWTAVFAGIAIIAANPLSYTVSADFARYLPRTSSRLAVAGWTGVGGFVTSVAVCSLGALAATTVDMSDPQTGLLTILPGWFAPFFLIALVLGTVALNALAAYSAGLALQALGVTIRRSYSVIVDGVASVSLTLYALLVSNLLDTVSNVLQLSLVLLGPSMAIYATDIVLRRNAYDGIALTDESRGSRFWFRGGVSPVGLGALLGGMIAAALCVNTVYPGPVAALLGGIDVSLPVGMLVAAALYVLLSRATGADRPGSNRDDLLHSSSMGPEKP